LSADNDRLALIYGFVLSGILKFKAGRNCQRGSIAGAFRLMAIISIADLLGGKKERSRVGY